MRYSVKQVASLWGVAPHTVYNLLERRELACVRIGRTIRVRDEDIEEYERRKCQAVNDNTPEIRTYGDTHAVSGTSTAQTDVVRLGRVMWKPPKST
jgi:excisionase family DNA binding protein